MPYTRDNRTHDGNFLAFYCLIRRIERGLFVVFVNVVVDTSHRGRVDGRCR